MVIHRTMVPEGRGQLVWVTSPVPRGWSHKLDTTRRPWRGYPDHRLYTLTRDDQSYAWCEYTLKKGFKSFICIFHKLYPSSRDTWVVMGWLYISSNQMFRITWSGYDAGRSLTLYYYIIPNRICYVNLLLNKLSAMFCFEGDFTHWACGSPPHFSYYFSRARTVR